MRDLLAAHRFTSGFPEGLVDELAACALGTVRWEPGTVIFRQGQQADRCYLITHGDVALEIHSPGAQPRIVQTVNGGEVLGWSWIFAPFRWSFDARALTSTEAIELDGARLREDGACDLPAEYRYLLMARFARLIVDRLHATRLQLLDVYASRD